MALVLLLVTLSGLAGCALDEPAADRPGARTATAAPSVPASPTRTPAGEAPVLSFDFDDLGALRAQGVGSGVLRVLNAGSERVTVRVSAVGGGELTSMPGREGGSALRFPVYGRGSGERVVLTAISQSVTDPLSPGTADFSFGADFAVDQVTEGTGLDNGNNLVQRGLSTDPGQYKLQIDRGRASCLVAGDAGDVLVEAEQRIRPHSWYHASCRRAGDVVTLDLGTYNGPPERASGSGRTGAVYVPAATPLVLGGKATPKGDAVVGDSDQFNGAMDNFFLTVEQGS